MLHKKAVQQLYLVLCADKKSGNIVMPICICPDESRANYMVDTMMENADESLPFIIQYTSVATDAAIYNAVRGDDLAGILVLLKIDPEELPFNPQNN